MYTIQDFYDVEEMLEDDISKLIYNNMILYRYSGKYEYINQIVENMNRSGAAVTDGRDLGMIISRNKAKQIDEIVIYGAGVMGKKIFTFLQQYDICPKCFIDQNAVEGQQIQGIPVYLPEKIVSNKSNIYIIAAIDTIVKNSMRKVLRQHGVDERKIYLGIRGYETQYFDKIISIKPDMVWIDGGGFIGDTALEIARRTDYNYKKIISFEPDEHNLLRFKENIQKEKLKNIQLEPYGLWNKQTVLNFCSDTIGGGSQINSSGDTSIKTISIDEVLQGASCDFIKMDIEGAELKALIGAEKTIKKYHPQMAICIYHKPEDYVEIPQYIKALYPDYKLFIRHYSNYDIETVLYAMP